MMGLRVTRRRSGGGGKSEAAGQARTGLFELTDLTNLC